jgi:hypothetical protein
MLTYGNIGSLLSTQQQFKTIYEIPEIAKTSMFCSASQPPQRLMTRQSRHEESEISQLGTFQPAFALSGP